MFNSEIKVVDEKFEVHVIDVERLSVDLIDYIDDHLVSICEGDSDTGLLDAKKAFTKFLSSKDDNKKIGAVSEFFVHLYLRNQGFKQEFLFFNLEEGSIKKGFDGYFSKSGKEYVVESKSGRSSTARISHKSKIDTAFLDVRSALMGGRTGGDNNPWRNAYNHACHIDVNANKSVRKNIKKISDMFDKKSYLSIDDINVIPCSTIFALSDETQSYTKDALSVFDGKSYGAKSVKAICITKSTFTQFIDFLGEAA